MVLDEHPSGESIASRPMVEHPQLGDSSMRTTPKGFQKRKDTADAVAAVAGGGGGPGRAPKVLGVNTGYP